MKLWLYVVFLMVSAPAGLLAQLCSLHVDVFQNDLQRIERPVVVRVVEFDGTVIQGLADSNGVDFCKLGVKPVDIHVGSEYCQTRMIAVPLFLSRTTRVKVLYDWTPCTIDVKFGPGCFCVLRAMTEGGEPFGPVLLRIEDSPDDKLKSDNAGRTFFGLKRGTSVSVVLSSLAGDFEGRGRFTCSPSTVIEEVKILMKRR